MTQHPNPSSPDENLPSVGKTKPGTRSGGATKKSQLIQMLSRKAGGDVEAISEKFGWLPHTTRAALSGLRKSGYELTKESLGGGKPLRYRITGHPAAGAV